MIIPFQNILFLKEATHFSDYFRKTFFLKKKKKLFIRAPTVAGRVVWFRICPSILPSVHCSALWSFHPFILLSGRFLGIGSLVFSETQHDVRSPCGVLHDKARFFLKKVLPPKWGKLTKNRVFWIGKSFLNLVYKESLYYLLHCYTNPKPGFWECSRPVRVQDF